MRIRYCIIVILFAIFSLCYSTSSHAYDSRKEWQDNVHMSISDDGIIGVLYKIVKLLVNCFLIQTDLLGFTGNGYSVTCLPNIIGRNVKDNYCSGSDISPDYINNVKAEMDNAKIGAVALITGIIATALVLNVVGLPLIITLLIPIGLILDLCLNSYILAPYEYVNQPSFVGAGGKDRDSNCLGTDGGCEPLLSAQDVPYFFQCNDKDSYGYLGAGYCDLEPMKSIGRNEAYTKMIGSITVVRNSFFGIGSTNSVTLSREDIKVAKSKSISGDFLPYTFRGYYRFDSMGRVQLCAKASLPIIPFTIGCTYVPPPKEELYYDEDMERLMNNTRCSYFLSNERTDLITLGIDLNQRSKGNSVVRFLLSDGHFMSTIIGCVQDLLVEIFIKPGTFSDQTESFFYRAKEGLRSIVIVTLMLYISLVGIKIIMSHQVPRTSEWVMFLLKFALVWYFAVDGDVWFSDKSFAKNENSASNQGGGNIYGIYPALIAAPDSIAKIFMKASNVTDVLQMCSYYKPDPSGEVDNNGQPVKYNIMLSDSSQALVQMANTKQGTRSIYNEDKDKQVILTTWDYLDCKLLNYLSLNTCKYNFAEMLGLWFFSAVDSIKGMLLVIVTIAFCMLIIFNLFRFVNLVILSMFVLTILVLFSPIMICFSLFSYTKQIFSSWLQTLIGYTIYPGMIFAFLALAFTIFDTIMYGNPITISKTLEQCKSQAIDPNNPITSCKINSEEICKSGESIVCTLMTVMNNKNKESAIDNCNILSGTMGGALTEVKHFDTSNWKSWLFGSYTAMKTDVIDSFWKIMLKLFIASLLLLILSTTVMEFLGALLDIYGATENLMNPFKIVKVGGKTAMTLAKGAWGSMKAAGAAAKKGAGAIGNAVGNLRNRN